jgi:hypothetical protein
MISQIYGIYDVKALHYGAPFTAPNVALAKRMVGDLATDPNTTVGRHPADFKLYGLGFFDDEKGTLTPFEIAEHVCDVITLLPMPATSGELFTYKERYDDHGKNRPNGAA